VASALVDQVTAEVHERRTHLPPLPPGGRQRARHVFSRDRRRLAWHYLGWVDPERVRLVNCMIGMIDSPWAHVFGDPNAASFYTAKIIKFPERRSELAKIRDDLDGMRRTMSVR
jgi:hypothetical protein